MNLKDLEESLPFIRWREPVRLSIMLPEGGSINRLCCRACIAINGLVASEIILGVGDTPAFKSDEAFRNHFAREHV